MSGRSLVVVGEHHPISISQPIPDATLQNVVNKGQANSTIVQGWKDIASTQISFSMPTPSKVTFSYIVSITQWGHPDWDAWTWNKFNAIGLRLVIDGLPFKESGTYADPNVKNTEDVIGDITMSLPAGPHIAKLQWKAVGTSVEEWRSLQSILDGFAGSRKLLAVLHPKNYAPLITTAPMQSVDEDKTVNIDIDVSDIDIANTPDSHLAVTLQSQNGTISLSTNEQLSFAVGNGKEDKYVRFSGNIDSVNKALSNITYQGHHDFHGLDNLTILVDDQGNTGGSGYGAVDVRTVQLNVEAKNDQPTFSVPAPQMVNEDTTLLINGVGIYDIDTRDAIARNSQFKVTLSVVSGRLSLLGSMDNLKFDVGDGTKDTTMAFQGSLNSINAALKRLTYRGDSDSNFEQAFEALTLHITDTGIDGMKSSASLNDTVVIPIRVNPVNDAPQIVLPRSQTVLISGYQVKDVDLKGNMQVNISVASSAGYITLVESHGITFLSSSTGLYERKISFEGNITSINAALKTLEYTRYPAFDGGDTLIFSFGNGKQNMVDTTLVELTINNNAKNTEHNPVILRISPSRVPVDGGSLIFVFGSNFNRLDRLFCQFGRDATVPAKVVSDKSLECITPALEHGSILLRVTNKRDLWTNSVEVAIDGRVSLVSLLPKRGSTRGGTDIIVEGENFPDSDVARCKFGLNAIVPALWLSTNSIKCTSPPRDMPGKPVFNLAVMA